jgi:hypothetical protein
MMKLKRFGGCSHGADDAKVGQRARTYKQAQAHANIVPSMCITLFVFGLAAYAQDVQTPATETFTGAIMPLIDQQPES